ncbi:MAG: D-2-hydroxyacid dehydrogenase family protein [Rhodospirillales bacterium]
MTKIAVLDDYLGQFKDFADWGSLPDGCDVTFFRDHLGFDEDKIAAALKDYNVVIGIRERTPFPESLIAKLPNLKLLMTTGMKNGSFDGKGAKQHGVVLCGTGTHGYSTVEHAWALIMSIVKNIPDRNRAMHEGRWQAGMAVSLKNKTLGLMGLGRLGSQIAKIGQCFNMNVIAWSQNLTRERCDEVGGVTRVDKDELFKQSDILSIHNRLSDRTRGLVGAAQFAMMKPTAFLINTSRGPIIDEQAILDALKKKTIAGAALDVYWTEPLPADHPIRALDNALLTGHCGYVMRENHQRNFTDAVENIKAWLGGNPVRVLNA